MAAKIFVVLLFVALPCYGQWQRSDIVDPMTDAHSVVYRLAGSDTQGLLTFSCVKGKVLSVMFSIPNGVEQFQKADVLGSVFVPFMTSYKIRVGANKATSLFGDLTPNLSAVDVKERQERMSKWFLAGRLIFETTDDEGNTHISEFSLADRPPDFAQECGLQN